MPFVSKTASILRSVREGILWRLDGVLDRKKSLTKLSASLRHVFAGRFNLGVCPICECRTVFVKETEWLRDHYRCVRCDSIPRWRAIIRVLETVFPQWRELRIHECSPGGASSDKLRAECKHYVPAYFFPDITPGQYKNGIRCENLERMTFENESFDLMVTQDVLEHVLNPDRAFREIARILKPGGAHVFTVPFYYWKETFVRALETSEGIKYLADLEYHGNPINSEGSLVVTEWGENLVDFIYSHSGMTTTIYQLTDRRLGLEAAFLEVFVSRKRLV